MAALLYKDFLIIATGQFDKDKELWMPIADMSWHSATGRESTPFRIQSIALGLRRRLKPSLLKQPRHGLTQASRPLRLCRYSGV